MSVICTFVLDTPTDVKPSDPIQYDCVECEQKVDAADIDKHALRHRAQMMRVFTSHGAYADYVNEQKIRKAVKSWQPHH